MAGKEHGKDGRDSYESKKEKKLGEVISNLGKAMNEVVNDPDLPRKNSERFLNDWEELEKGNISFVRESSKNEINIKSSGNDVTYKELAIETHVKGTKLKNAAVGAGLGLFTCLGGLFEVSLLGYITGEKENVTCLRLRRYKDGTYELITEDKNEEMVKTFKLDELQVTGVLTSFKRTMDEGKYVAEREARKETERKNKEVREAVKKYS